MHVMQDWTAEISLRQQGVIVLALRGPDGLTKESGCKNALRTLRACTMNSGRERKPMELGTRWESDPFMRMDLIKEHSSWVHTADEFLRDIDTYNIHFLQHFMHAAAAVGFNHPIPIVSRHWIWFYERICRKLHVKPETEQEFKHRLRDGIRTDEEEAA